ncbi:hypothetical protein A8H37_08330 [Burkholderia thailandensis]|nr:hypothetical protein A8H37_08330 [Burkholderia thailandensis]
MGDAGGDAGPGSASGAMADARRDRESERGKGPIAAWPRPPIRRACSRPIRRFDRSVTAGL